MSRWQENQANRKRAIALMADALTPATAREVVECIRALADDDEVAHGIEDDLHLAVLKQVAAGDPNAKELAAIAASTEALDFSRWCA
jgi:hypothetical protein